jgi:hypothetical protein
MIHFCPNCGGEIRENASVCPHCQYELANYNHLPYEDKLILALRHPVRENRILAIQLLGDIRSKSAISAFGYILHEENDFYVIREIIHSLRKIAGVEWRTPLSATQTQVQNGKGYGSRQMNPLTLNFHVHMLGPSANCFGVCSRIGYSPRSNDIAMEPTDWRPRFASRSTHFQTEFLEEHDLIFAMIFSATILCQAFVEHLCVEPAEFQLSIFLHRNGERYVVFIFTE